MAALSDAATDKQTPATSHGIDGEVSHQSARSLQATFFVIYEIYVVFFGAVELPCDGIFRPGLYPYFE
ncbi:MAG TPA: hypothetical protein VN809_00420 [Telmatospirillum sp.]|nr:hypothetical protein [Telmatospirillum sp.]